MLKVTPIPPHTDCLRIGNGFNLLKIRIEIKNRNIADEKNVFLRADGIFRKHGNLYARVCVK